MSSSSSSSSSSAAAAAGDSNSQVGQVLQNLPLEYLIATPLSAACEAQTRLSESSINFIKSVTYDQDDKLQTLTFTSSSTTVDPTTHESVTSTKTSTVPLVTMINLPCMYIQKVDVDLVVSVNAISQESTKQSAQKSSFVGVNADASYSFGGFSASAKVAYNASCSLSSQVASQNALSTSTTYTIHVEAMNEKPPGLAKMLDFMLQ